MSCGGNRMGAFIIGSQYIEFSPEHRKYLIASIFTMGALLWIARINDLRPEDL